jgi:membrane protease YdiL (CAAX protease family)
LVWSDGQGPRQLGFTRAGLGRELLLGGPALVGAYVAHLAAAIPLVLIATLLNLAKDEALVRKELATSLVGSGLSIPAFAAAMVLIASFEELAFRGFLVPRLRQVFGRWWMAVALSSVLFGLGHVYEGTLAIVQTAVLGAYFGAVFLLRFRLASVMVAHGLFNTLNFALMVWMERSGLLEHLSGGLPK